MNVDGVHRIATTEWQQQRAPRLRPLSLAMSLTLFAASALVARLCIYGLLPSLIDAGVVPFWAFIISYGLLLTLMIVAAFVGLRLEGYPWTVGAISERFRFHRLRGRAWLWTLGLFVVGFLGTGALRPTAQVIARVPAFAPPHFLPTVLNPLAPQSLAFTQFMGLPLRGNWWVAAVYLVFLTCLNILGEEIWFRGYILPRQELSHGKRTWAVHGLLWTLFHVAIYPWYLIYLLPTALTVSYAAQRNRTTWSSYVVHLLGNGLLAMIPITLGVVGAGR